MSVLRTIIVDDEEPARELLRALLTAWPDVRIVGESGDGTAALALIQRDAPDLVFLDVQMPGLTGIEIASELLDGERVPSIVFVTAYDRYAIKAFEVSACDYLLKPFDADRLRATVERVLARRRESPADVLGALRSFVATGTSAARGQVIVKTDGRHLFLDPDEIEWIEAVGKELKIHLATSVVMARETMNALEARLDPARFVRVQRSAIVNRVHIREVQPWFKGDYVLILKRGTRVVSGRTYRAAVQRLLEG
jgi:two-component system LytT family response regulator